MTESSVRLENDTVIIELSKRKILLQTLGCIAFVLLGVTIWYKADFQAKYPPLYLKLMSIITIVFFGGGGLLLLYKLADKGSGLILDNYGIQLNYGGNKSPITIKWRNITGFEIKEIKRTKILLVFINNAEELINTESMWKQRLIRLGLKMYGTPISLSTGTFNCSFDELVKLLNEKWQQNKVK